MTLTAGRRLGTYDVVSPLGAGGMGEVWRATDTRLGRDVALKLLPAAFASDPDRLARFEREAKVLASLNHPGIAHLYGFESVTLEDGTKAHLLVMELADGEDLAERLKRGPLPVDEAVVVARQIAEALEEAHDKGIVHRDLKPANVKLTPGGKVKVLDFGLAKAWEGPGAASSDLSQSPTLAHTGTAAGLILGTAAYMSPEQARGKTVDRRADIWAFGVVLFEMLTGRKLFEGETVSDVLAAVLTRQPQWAELPSETPGAVRRLLERCLERDPKLRLRDIGEARVGLLPERVAEAPAPATKALPRGQRLLQVAPWLLALALGVVAFLPRGEKAGGTPGHGTVRFSFDARDALRPTVRLSPDGRLLAFNQADSSENGIFIRALASLEARLLPGTGRSGGFFWSPDGRELAAILAGRLVAVDVGTGVSRTIATLPEAPTRGGTWNRDGVILISLAGAVHRVSAAGGALALVLTPEKDRSSWHGNPLFLPDGKRFLVTSEVREGGENLLVVQVSELATPATARVVLKRALLVGLADGHLVYATPEGRLEVVPVDPDRLEPVGEPRVLAQQVSYDTRTGFVAASAVEGALAYRLGRDPQSEFVWMDGSGRRLGRLGEPGPWHNFDLSLDGTRVIATTRRRGTSSSLFLLDTARGVTSPALDSPEAASDPTWSPDGTRIAYRIRATLVARAAQGGEEKVLVREVAYPDSWSRDGKWLAYGAPRLGHYDLFAVAVDEPERPPVLLVAGNPQADEPRFSPDGRWVAYHATASGGIEQVSVIPFPPTGERWQISGDGGVQPRWAPGGEELFYLDREGRLVSVALPGSDPRRAGAPRPLFDTGLEPSAGFDQFAVGPKGRFLFRIPFGSDPGVPVHVILGWNRPNLPLQE